MAKSYRSALRSLRSWYRILRRRRNRPKVLAGIGVLIVTAAIIMTVQPSSKTVDPTAYGPLLSVIAEGESKGNYNAYYNNAGNASIRFTDMTLDEVLQWQQEYVQQGSVSSAVGRYQIVRPTMLELVQKLGLDTSAKFDENLQDRLAIALLERRGSLEYVNQQLSREQFAANLAKEWAALPKVVGDNPSESYYAGDGINVSRISLQSVLDALDALKVSPQI